MHNYSFEQVYVGAGKYVYEDTWVLMLMKNHSRFVREMAEVLWTRDILKKRYIRKPTKQNPEIENNLEVDEEENEDSLKPLTPEKYKLLKGITC